MDYITMMIFGAWTLLSVLFGVWLHAQFGKGSVVIRSPLVKARTMLDAGEDDGDEYFKPVKPPIKGL